MWSRKKGCLYLKFGTLCIWCTCRQLHSTFHHKMHHRLYMSSMLSHRIGQLDRRRMLHNLNLEYLLVPVSFISAWAHSVQAVALVHFKHGATQFKQLALLPGSTYWKAVHCWYVYLTNINHNVITIIRIPIFFVVFKPPRN
jgi:hypothetical protein